MRMGFGAAIGLCAMTLAGTAQAEPVPDPLVRIITEAAKTGDPGTLATTADLAKKASPASAAEIDALVANLNGQAEAARVAKLESQGFFEGWSGEGEVGASLTTGTSKNTNVALGIGLVKDGITWRHKIAAAANYQRSDGVTTADRTLASYEANYKFSPRFYALGTLMWERDKFAGFNARYTESLGLGYNILIGPTLFWDVSGGPALRQTRFVSGRNSDDLAGRLATHFAWNLAAATVLTEDAGVYLGGTSNTYFSTTALTSRIVEDISGRVSFGVVSESNPPPGVQKTNTISRFTLVYSF
jgi:putative salt-induced outer membrane protein